MTLIIALCCTDGVIMASDSQATESTGNVRWEVEKIFQMSTHAVMGGSGMDAALTEIRKDVEEKSGLLDQMEESKDIDQSIVSIVKPILEKHYERFIPDVPGEPKGVSPATDILIAGFTEARGGWILEVDRRCQCTYYQEKRGFHAVGSGAGFAQLANALMKHFAVKERPMAHGRLIAYRTVRTVIDTAAYHVGGEIQMWEVTKDGIKQLSQEEIAEVETAVGGWEEAEVNTLDEVMNPGEAGDGPPMPDEVSPD